jgi:hypothetical protein
MRDFAVAMGMGMGVGDSLLFKEDLTVHHAIDLIGRLGDKIHVVGYKDIGDVNIFENAYDSFCGIRVKARGRLIQEQDFGLHSEYCGKRDQFLFPP